MANIVVANMQANLTLDKGQFDQAAQGAKDDLKQIQDMHQQATQAAGTSGTGQDAQKQQSQQRINDQAAVTQAQLQGISQVNAAQQGATTTHDTAMKQRKAATDAAAQAEKEQAASVNAAWQQVAATKAQALTPAQQAAVARMAQADEAAAQRKAAAEQKIGSQLAPWEEPYEAVSEASALQKNLAAGVTPSSVPVPVTTALTPDQSAQQANIAAAAASVRSTLQSGGAVTTPQYAQSTVAAIGMHPGAGAAGLNAEEQMRAAGVSEAQIKAYLGANNYQGPPAATVAAPATMRLPAPPSTLLTPTAPRTPTHLPAPAAPPAPDELPDGSRGTGRGGSREGGGGRSRQGLLGALLPSGPPSLLRATYGESETYERFAFRQSIGGSVLTDILQPVLPGFTALLPALTATGVGLTAFAAALGEGTKAAIEESTARFQLNEQIKNTQLAPGGTSGEFNEQQTARLRTFGIGPQDATSLLTTIERFTQTPAEIQRTQQEAVDFARTFGTSVQQAQQMLIDASQGNAGAFHQYIPNIYQGDTLNYVRQQVDARTAGAGAAFMGTPGGDTAKLSADTQQLMLDLGQRMLPIIDGLVRGLDTAMPLLDAFGNVVGVVLTAFGDLAQVLGDIVSPITNLVGKSAAVHDFFGTVGDGLQNMEHKSQAFIDWLNTQASQSALTQATGYSFQNGKLGVMGDTTVPSLQQQLDNLAKLNPQLGSSGTPTLTLPGVAGTAQTLIQQGLTTPGPMGGPAPWTMTGPTGWHAGAPQLPPTTQWGPITLPRGGTTGSAQNVILQTIRQRYPGLSDEAAMQRAIQDGMFTQGGQLVPTGPPSQVPGATPSTAPAGGAGGQLGGQLADTAIAQVSAMRQISEETQLSQTAISGVQNVFSQLTTFHVDFSQVKANLDNLQQGIEYLQQFWVKTATAHETGITQHDYDVTKTWLEMVSSMLTVMQSGLSTLSDVYRNSGEMPSQTDLQTLVDRMENAFEFTNTLAQAVFKGHGTGDQSVAMAQLKAWADDMTALMQLLTGGSDAMSKIFTLPIPDQSRIDEAAQRTVGMVGALEKAFNDAFVKQNATGGVTIDSGLANAGAMAKNANDLITFASGSADLFRKMTNLYVPTPDEVKVAVERAMGVASQIADAMEAQIANPRNTGAGPDRTLKAAADAADNNAKLLSMMQAGVGVLAGMRTLYVPSPAEVSHVVNGVFMVLNDAVAQLPAYDPERLAKIQAWGTAVQPIMGVISSGIQSVAGMKNLYVPTSGEISHIINGVFLSLDDALGHMPAYNPETLKRIEDWGTSIGPVYSAVNAGVGAIAQMRNLYVPSAGEIKTILTAAFHALDDALAQMPNDNPEQLARITEWGNAMSAMFSALQGGVQTLQGIRNLYEPGVEQMQEFRKNWATIQGEFAGVTQSINPEQASRIEDWGNSMSAEMAGLKAGADALQAIRDLRFPTAEMMGEFKQNFITLQDMGFDEALQYSIGQTDKAKNWGEAMTAVFQATNGGAQVIAQMHDIIEPTKQQITEFDDNLLFISKDFLAAAQKFTPDMTHAMEEYGQTLSTVMEGLNASAQFQQAIPQTMPLPKGMITAYFKNLDQVVVEFHDEAQVWKKHMELENSNFAVDLGKEVDALTKTADMFDKMGNFRVDYSGQIHMLFSNMDQVIVMFNAEAKSWQGRMSANTSQFSTLVGNEMDAVNKALDPMTKMLDASVATPQMIDMAFSNIHYALGKFEELSHSPELQGDNLGSLTQFSAAMNDVFGAIKNAADAAAELNTPAGSLGGQNFTSVMESFFMVSVPKYAGEWVKQMSIIQGAAQGMSQSVRGDLAAIPIQVGQPARGAAGQGAQGQAAAAQAGPVYNSCIIINDVAVGSKQDAESVYHMLMDAAVTRQGGIPVKP